MHTTHQKVTNGILWAMMLYSAGALLTGCSSTDSSSGTTPTPTPTSTAFRQIERLGRPAINEGLVISNAFLNAYNSIPPTADLSTAAAAVVAEAAATIDAVDAGDGTENVTTGDVAETFLPDVMRIDTSIASPVGTEAYTATRPEVFNQSSTGGLGAPCAGRKLEDDVMDATLVRLVGPGVSDNVPYTRPASGPGSANEAIGHHLLNGQTTPKGAATFPFLAPAN